MKKVFEAFLILIIFYGVYSVFNTTASYFFKNLTSVWIVLIALFVSILIVLVYRLLVQREIKKKMKKEIDYLTLEIQNKEHVIREKEREVQKAQSFKENLIAEAEASELVK